MGIDEVLKGLAEQILNGRPFSDDHMPTALSQAMEYAGSYGVVASLPYLIYGKALADKDSYLWKDWFTALTEENVGIDRKGRLVSAGQSVVLTIHGGGTLTPDRIQRAYDEGLTTKYAATLDDEEFDNLLNGMLPSGESLHIYSLDDVKKGNVHDPFGRYAVWLDLETARATHSGYHKKDSFMNNPLIIARAGTLEHLETYFEKTKHKKTQSIRNSHLLNESNPSQPLGRMLFLSNIYFGIFGCDSLLEEGNFVGVAPEEKPWAKTQGKLADRLPESPTETI